MDQSSMRKLQLERLQQTVERLYYNVTAYRAKMQSKGMEPGDVKSLDDLRHLPTTSKQDLRDAYPYDLFAVPLSEIVRLHASSGTTGKPTVVGYTRNDISMWAELMARSLTSAGSSKSAIIQNAYGYGLFTGALGVHYGAEKIGAAVIPVSGGNTKRQIMLLEDFAPTLLACTPSYALQIAEVLEEQGVDMDKLHLRWGLFGAEPWSEEMRRELETKLRLTALDIYGLSEIIGPGVACECPEKKGMHINEDHFIPEIIDPLTEEPLPYGEKGELVFTTITKEGMPLIRYRTRDISRLFPERCACGRTLIRMERVSGRTDDMLIIRGVNVFPSQVESVLLGISGVEPHYILIVDRKGNLDTLEVQVEVSQSLFSDEVRRLEELENRITKEIESNLGVGAKVRLVEPKSIPRSEGKAKRVIDNRKI
jgi:phenylacetate-CoA ligase